MMAIVELLGWTVLILFMIVIIIGALGLLVYVLVFLCEMLDEAGFLELLEENRVRGDKR